MYKNKYTTIDLHGDLLDRLEEAKEFEDESIAKLMAKHSFIQDVIRPEDLVVCFEEDAGYGYEYEENPERCDYSVIEDAVDPFNKEVWLAKKTDLEPTKVLAKNI